MTEETTTTGDVTDRDAGHPEGARVEDPDFEEALSELEAIVRALESEDLELDQALSLFERGVRRLRLATRLLDDAEGRVEELIEESSGVLAVAELEVDVEDGGEGDG